MRQLGKVEDRLIHVQRRNVVHSYAFKMFYALFFLFESPISASNNLDRTSPKYSGVGAARVSEIRISPNLRTIFGSLLAKGLASNLG